MPVKVADCFKALFRRNRTKAAPVSQTNRFRQTLESYEDRLVPSTVVYDGTVGLSGLAGTADVELTVTADAPGYTGLYLWNYHITNTGFTGDEKDDGIGTVLIPVADTNAIGNISTTSGFTSWVQTTGPAEVWFGQEGGARLMYGDSADFSFTTAPAALASATLSVDTVGGDGAATGSSFGPGAALPVVSVAQVSDAVEGGTDGTFEFTRTGDTSSSLTVNFSVSGTATSGTDYTSIGSTVTFAADSATVDVNVAALHDSVDDPDETVDVTVTSGTGYSVGSPSSAELNVIDVPDLLPTAFDSTTTTDVNVPADVAVLDFASDLDGDALTLTGVTDGDNGTVSINMDGTVTYTPDTDFVGDDSFTYTIEDGFGNTSTGTISVTVTAPIAAPASVWTAENTSINIAAADLAFDPDGDDLTVTAVTQGDHGTVTIELDGTVTYTPDTSFSGEDSFTYTVEDGDGNQATQTITVTVGDTDPVAIDDSATTATNTATDVTITDIAFAPAGGTVTVTAITQGTHGTVVNNNDGTVTYTPNTGYTGADTFTYTITDAASHTATGTITVTVGTAAPTAADEIEDTLADIQDEIDNYDDDSPAAIETAATAVTSAITDYISDVNSIRATSNIDTLAAAGGGLKDLIKSEINGYQKLYASFNELKSLEATYANALAANKILIETLAGQLKAALATPNVSPTLIYTLAEATNVLLRNQRALRRAYLPIFEAAHATRTELIKLKTALIFVLPGPMTRALLDPEALPDRGDFSQFFPKRP